MCSCLLLLYIFSCCIFYCCNSSQEVYFRSLPVPIQEWVGGTHLAWRQAARVNHLSTPHPNWGTPHPKRRNPGLSLVLQRRRPIILLSKSFTCQFSILSLLVVHKRAHTDLPHSVSWKRWEEGMGGVGWLGGGSPRLYVIQTRAAGNTYVFSFPMHNILW